MTHIGQPPGGTEQGGMAMVKGRNERCLTCQDAEKEKGDLHGLYAYHVLRELTHFLSWKIRNLFSLANEVKETRIVTWFAQGGPASLSA